jgi:hypothetical protein
LGHYIFSSHFFGKVFKLFEVIYSGAYGPRVIKVKENVFWPRFQQSLTRSSTSLNSRAECETKFAGKESSGVHEIFTAWVPRAAGKETVLERRSSSSSSLLLGAFKIVRRAACCPGNKHETNTQFSFCSTPTCAHTLTTASLLFISNIKFNDAKALCMLGRTYFFLRAQQKVLSRRITHCGAQKSSLSLSRFEFVPFSNKPWYHMCRDSKLASFQSSL